MDPSAQDNLTLENDFYEILEEYKKNPLKQTAKKNFESVLAQVKNNRLVYNAIYKNPNQIERDLASIKEAQNANQRAIMKDKRERQVSRTPKTSKTQHIRAAARQAAASQKPAAAPQAVAYQQPAAAAPQAVAPQQPATAARQAAAYQQPAAAPQAVAYQQPAAAAPQAVAYQQPAAAPQAVAPPKQEQPKKVNKWIKRAANVAIIGIALAASAAVPFLLPFALAAAGAVIFSDKITNIFKKSKFGTNTTQGLKIGAAVLASILIPPIGLVLAVAFATKLTKRAFNNIFKGNSQQQLPEHSDTTPNANRSRQHDTTMQRSTPSPQVQTNRQGPFVPTQGGFNYGTNNIASANAHNHEPVVPQGGASYPSFGRNWELESPFDDSPSPRNTGEPRRMVDQNRSGTGRVVHAIPVSNNDTISPPSTTPPRPPSSRNTGGHGFVGL